MLSIQDVPSTHSIELANYLVSDVYEVKEALLTHIRNGGDFRSGSRLKINGYFYDLLKVTRTNQSILGYFTNKAPTTYELWQLKLPDTRNKDSDYFGLTAVQRDGGYFLRVAYQTVFVRNVCRDLAIEVIRHPDFQTANSKLIEGQQCKSELEEVIKTLLPVAELALKDINQLSEVNGEHMKPQP
ncbi:MAG: hypothetical protein ACPGUD_04135 [Parashewanella sp.]